MSLSKSKGLSLAELILTLTISSILLIAAFPLLIKLPKADDSNSIACIKAELAANLSSSYCSQAITNCKYKRNNACKTISFLANHGKSEEQTAARKVLQEICNQDGQDACKYFLEDCQKNSDNCNIAASDYDLNYYLNLPATNSTTGRIRIEELGKSFYNIGYPNIVSEVDNTCCNPVFNTACKVKSTLSCSWQKLFNRAGSDDAWAVRIDSTGNIFVGGTASGDFVVIKMHPEGNLLWQQRYHGGSTDNGYDVMIADSGNIFLGGYVFTDSNYDLTVIKLSPGGSIIWQKNYDGGADTGFNINIDSNENVYITGSSDNGNNDIAIVKTNSDGNITWGKRLSSTNNISDTSCGVMIADSGNIYITGYSTASNSDIPVVKLSPDGNIIWQRRFNSSNNSGDYAFDLRIDSSENVYIAGKSYNGTRDAHLLLKLNSSGSVVWAKRYVHSARNSWSWNLELETGGNLYLAGYTYNGSNNDMTVIKLNSDGNILWDKMLDSSYNSNDEAKAVVSDNQENIYVTGYVNNGSNDDIFLVKMKINQESDNIFTASDVTFTDTVPAFSDAGGYTEKIDSFTTSNPGYSVISPGFTGIK
ncbi:MAG TPA: hypothetical protein DDX14_00420 [Cyanobacteria bacterium UBA9579]|nr:hypothetical protein [Cyanobacteria bacterium UBA9579]